LISVVLYNKGMRDKYYLNKWLDSLRLCRGSIPTVDHQLSNLVEWFEL
jgi:hypothetical protein